MIPIWQSVSVLLLYSSVRCQKESVLFDRHVEEFILVTVVHAACRKAGCCRSSVGKTRPSCLNAIMPARAGERAGTEWCKTDCGNNAFALPDTFFFFLGAMLFLFWSMWMCWVCMNSYSLDSNYWRYAVCVSLGYDCKSFALLKWAGVWKLCRIFLKEPSYASKTFKVITCIKKQLQVFNSKKSHL